MTDVAAWQKAKHLADMKARAGRSPYVGQKGTGPGGGPRTAHDPFAPPDEPGADFQISRWQRAGATPEEVEKLQAAHGEMDPAGKMAEGATIGGTSDIALREALGRMRETGDFGGYMAAPAPPPAPPEAPQVPVEAPAEPAAPTGAEAENAAAHGEWRPAGALPVDGVSYPAWDLEGGWVGTRVGDEVTGVHLMAPTRDALAERVRTQVKG